MPVKLREVTHGKTLALVAATFLDRSSCTPANGHQRILHAPQHQGVDSDRPGDGNVTEYQEKVVRLSMGSADVLSDSMANGLRRAISVEFDKKMYELLSEKEELMKAELEQEADKILEEIENNLKRTSDEMSSLEQAIKDLQDNDDLHEASELLKRIEAVLNWPDLMDNDPYSLPVEQSVPSVSESFQYDRTKDGDTSGDFTSPRASHLGPEDSKQMAALAPGSDGHLGL